ncbi:MAG: hypothetical protein LC721_04270 [Actinobacteria bacterium]|nr:hypothetical protein [Actinomycetota bacterium]
MTMRGLAIGASAVVAVGVIGLAYLLGAHSSPPRPGNASTIEVPRRAAPPAGPLESPALQDPVAAATAWLLAYRGIAWTDRSPSSWVDRVRPYVSSDLAAEYEQARQGNAGTNWATFVHDRCTATAHDVDGVVPPEAPRALDSVYVLVSGTVVTECAAGAPTAPTEPVAATVEVRRMPDGRWIVNRRLF